MLRADVPLALDVLSDILTNPTFEPEELAREKNVIVQEIGATEDTPDDLIFEYLQAVDVSRTSRSAARSSARPRSVRSFDSRRLRGYLARNYRAPRHGDRGRGRGRSRAGRRRGRAALRRRSPARRAPLPEPATFAGGARIEQRDLEQVHVAFALEGVPQRDPSIYSLQVFTNVLGGGMSSRLFQEVREIRGLCYPIYAFHAAYADTGVLGVYAGTDASDLPELMRVVVDEIGNAAETLSEAEINRSKAQMKAGLLMALESSGARAEQLARQMMIYGRPIPLEEIVGKIEAVTVESARAAGRALIGRSRPAVAVLGPGRGLERAAVIAESLGRRAA